MLVCPCAVRDYILRQMLDEFWRPKTVKAYKKNPKQEGTLAEGRLKENSKNVNQVTSHTKMSVAYFVCVCGGGGGGYFAI
jgi:hypothetical protein